MSRLPDTFEEIVENARRCGGAVIIARCMAIQQDELSRPSQVHGAAHWEAVMRDRHGDPKPEWLARRIFVEADSLADHRDFMAQLRDEAELYKVNPDDRREGEFFTYAEELAIAHCRGNEP